MRASPACLCTTYSSSLVPPANTPGTEGTVPQVGRLPPAAWTLLWSPARTHIQYCDGLAPPHTPLPKAETPTKDSDV